jgi:hypothetical protein
MMYKRRYRLQAKRPHETTYSEWCSTEDYQAVLRNIDTIESYGWMWRICDGDGYDES